MKKYILILTLLLPSILSGQVLKGIVTDSAEETLTGANVHWIGTTVGISTDESGEFEITLAGIEDRRLVASFIGYKTDTLLISSRMLSILKKSKLRIRLNKTHIIGEIEITADHPDAYISKIKPIKTEVITEAEIGKSACCDLAGCFNTQSSVQPTTTNIVTSAKELRIMGLSGVYNQILVDGMPMMQGLTYTYGVSTIPGTLVRNIYVAKGANSVLQGYESISGQINVELKESDDADKIYFNTYVNSFLTKRINFNYTHKWEKWSTLVAAHTSQPGGKFDRDEDTFLDQPLVTRYSIYNKWKYGDKNKKGLHSRTGLRYVYENRIGGQVEFNPATDEGTMNYYGQTVQFFQPEIYTQTGYRFNSKHQLTIQASAFQQEQTAYFGTTRYEAAQQNAYANLQYELTWNKNHSLKTGLSYRYINLEEDITLPQDSLNRTYAGKYLKNEQIPGVFVENTFSWKESDLILITGIRMDNHNTFGLFVTPRALLKYNIAENTTARVSVGTGWRTLNLFSENVNLLASSKNIVIAEDLQPEQAINYGANLTHSVYGEDIETSISLDYYRTQFLNQISPDYDRDPTQIYIDNFTDKSIANSLLAEVKFSFYNKVAAKIGYNYLDVYRVREGKKFTLPFNPTHRVTSSFSFKPLSKKWHLDIDVHWYGKQRLANTTSNPIEFQRPEMSEAYSLTNVQFTKTWEKLEIYGGCENIFDFHQERAILSWDKPFGKYFDTSSVWGPVAGREFYIGLRYKIK